LLKNAIFGILFFVALCLPVGFGLSGCDPDTEHYFQANGTVYQVVYTYVLNVCVGWQIVQVGSSGPPVMGSDCGDAVPAMRALTAVPGAAGSGSSPLAAKKRPRTASGSQGVLLVADAFTGIDAFDLATSTQLATMPVNGNPTDLVSLPGQNTAYAVIFPSNGASPGIAVVDGGKLQISANISLPANTFPIYGALSPGGATLYVSNAGSSDLSVNPNTSILVIDTASQKVTGSIPLPSNQNLFGNYQRLAVSPDGSLLYAGSSEGYLEAIDTRTLSPVSFIQLAPFLFAESDTPTPHMVFALDGRAVYVAVLGPNAAYIVAIDPDTSQQVKSVQVGSATSYISDLALSPDGNTLLAMDGTTGITYTLNTTAFTQGTPIPRPNLPPNTSVPIVYSGFVIQQ
jgi:6-phosphogluconolactonase (cycloisomerase 2 family)